MKNVTIHEVGMRDGLQIEQQIVPTDRKIEWIAKLAASGLDMIQVGSFVNPVRVPQMADTDELFRRLASTGRARPGVVYTGLVLNEKGLDRAMACGVEFVCMGVSASDTHSRKNTGMGTAEATERIIAMGRQSVAAGTPVQVSVQSAFGCGFEGVIPERRVIDIVARFADAGLTTVSLADSSGHADPDQVEAMIGAVEHVGSTIDITCHFHNTFGMGLANVYAAYRAGVRTFEVGFGGLGGCPFVALAAGNVCTEDVVHMFQRWDVRRDIDVPAICEVTKEAAAFFQKALPGTIHRTGSISHRGRFATPANG